MLPIELHLENFMSHRSSQIDFTQFSSALLMGKNGAGKSTILAAIGFCLFGKTHLDTMTEVVKVGTNLAKVTFVFEHEGNKYKVIRAKHAKHANLDDLSFFIDKGGSWDRVPGDTKSEISEAIKKLLKSNYDIFINTSYFQQYDLFAFMGGTPADKMKIVASLLSLDRWDAYSKNAAKEQKIFTEQLDLANIRLQDFANLDSDLLLANQTLLALEESVKSLTLEDSQIKAELPLLEQKLNNLLVKESSVQEYHDLVAREKSGKVKVSDLRFRISEQTQLSESLQKQIDSAKLTISDIDVQVQELSETIQLKSKYNVADLEQKIVKGRVKKDLLTEQINNISNNDVCKECDSPLTHSRHTKVAEKTEELAQLSAKLKSAEEFLASAKQVETKVHNAERQLENYMSRKRAAESQIEISSIKLKMAQQDAEVKTAALQQELQEQKEIQESLARLHALGDLSELSEVKAQVLSLKGKLQEVSNKIKADSMALGACKQRIDTMLESKAKVSELEVQRDNFKKQAYIYGVLSKSFSRNGIQAIIIDNVIAELGRVTNKALAEFSAKPMYVNIVTQTKDTKGAWKETFEIEIVTQDGVRSFSALSGGEKFRVTFSMRLALNQLLAKRMGGEVQMLLLDEVSSSLDPEGLEVFISMIKRLERDVKVLIITHDDRLKDAFDHAILVEMTESGSVVSQ